MQDRSFPKKLDVMDDATADMPRKKTPAERLAMVSDANDNLRILVAAGVRWQHPDWDEAQVQKEMVRRMTREAD
ncbi:MAG: hypothetical protein JNJ77_10200 [Planctomycetia bacterium]|nr:hypothetical protein [Planctomycetia bacterium]